MVLCNNVSRHCKDVQFLHAQHYIGILCCISLNNLLIYMFLDICILHINTYLYDLLLKYNLFGILLIWYIFYCIYDHYIPVNICTHLDDHILKSNYLCNFLIFLLIHNFYYKNVYYRTNDFFHHEVILIRKLLHNF